MEYSQQEFHFYTMPSEARSKKWKELTSIVRELLQEDIPPTLVFGRTTLENIGFSVTERLRAFLEQEGRYYQRTKIPRPPDPLAGAHLDPTRVSSYKPAMVEYLASFGLRLENPSLLPVVLLEAVANYVERRKR